MYERDPKKSFGIPLFETEILVSILFEDDGAIHWITELLLNITDTLTSRLLNLQTILLFKNPVPAIVTTVPPWYKNDNEP